MQTSVKHPPGPTDTWLGEAIVHAEDIRRPLGIEHQYPTEAVVRVADFYKGSNLLIGSKNRIADLTLRATDTDWSHGTGPEVSGPILSLVMAMTGRKAGARRPDRRRRGDAASAPRRRCRAAPSGSALSGRRCRGRRCPGRPRPRERSG